MRIPFRYDDYIGQLFAQAGPYAPESAPRGCKAALKEIKSVKIYVKNRASAKKLWRLT